MPAVQGARVRSLDMVTRSYMLQLRLGTAKKKKEKSNLKTNKKLKNENVVNVVTLR